MNANRDLARFSLGGCNGGEPSAHLRFRARCTWMQHTTLIRRGTTGRTRDGGDLFGGEFAPPHLHKMRHPRPASLSKIAHPPGKKASLNFGSRTIAVVRSGGLIGSRSVHSQKGSARGAQQIITGFTVFQRHACVGYPRWPSRPGSQSEVGCRLPELSCELHSLGSREGTQARSMANLCTFSQAEVWKQS